MPKTVTYKNVLAYIYKIDEPVGYTHCYFPSGQFDETFETGKWLFGRKCNAYVAVYSLKPYVKTQTGKYKNRELLCFAKRNIWLIEVGNQAQYGDFMAFIQAVSQARMNEMKEDIEYTSPSVGMMRLGWDQTCLVGGKPALEKDFPLIRNGFAEGEYGSGLTYLQLGGRQKILNFNM